MSEVPAPTHRMATGDYDDAHVNIQGAGNGMQAIPPAQQSWESLGDKEVFDAVVACNQDGRLEVFARGNDDTLQHICQTDNNKWGPWAALDENMQIMGKPGVATNKDGLLEVFAGGKNNTLQHICQIDNNKWGPWAALDENMQIMGKPGVATNKDGLLEVFARGKNNTLQHIRQTDNNKWGPWAALDENMQITGEPAVATNRDGSLEVFARGKNNTLQHIRQTDNNKWGPWAALDENMQITGKPAVARNADGRLEAFVLGSRYEIWHIWQIRKERWGKWTKLGESLTEVTHMCVGSIAGRLEVFIVVPPVSGETYDSLYHTGQTEPDSDEWKPWSSIGGQLGSDDGPPVAICTPSSQLYVFAKGDDGNLWHTRLDANDN